jgi:DNA-directed RNA polymerase subunit L
MDISIETVDKDTIKIHVMGEGPTLMNMLKHKLLENKNVLAAGYRQEHPLIDKTTLFVKAKTNPKAAVVASLKELGKEWKELEIK